MTLDTCGCCRGVEIRTPQLISNRPGLNAISYRVGQHPSFKESMLAQLSKALPNLNTRENSDFTIALLDALALIADTLTFYQERIANESYLRTATERRSLLELARLIGYELRPGVSANVYLAFTIENDAGEITIPAGTQAQHIPVAGELPQKFETSVDILARSEWNIIKARQTERHPYIQQNGSLRDSFFLEGVTTNLRIGDRLLMVANENDPSGVFLRVVNDVDLQPQQQRTEVDVSDPTLSSSNLPTVLAAPVLTNPISNTTQTYYGQVLSSGYLNTVGVYQSFDAVNVYLNLAATQPLPPGILTFRSKASIFGHNAPKWETLPANLRKGEVIPTSTTGTTYITGPFNNRNRWVDNLNLATTLPSSLTAVANKFYLHLDTTYDVAPNSTVVLQDGTRWLHGIIVEVSEVSLSDYTLSAKVTRLLVHSELLPNLAQFSVRGTSVYLQSEELKLARLPITGSVQGNQIQLEGWIDGLPIGQNIILCGELADDLGNSICEQAIITRVDQDISHEGGTVITLETDLSHHYVRQSVEIMANVALATHGEHKKTVLGSGNAAIPFQTFSFPDKPLTHISSSTYASGAEPSLAINVNNIQWHLVENLQQSLASDHHYTLRYNHDGSTTAYFGDGQHGARLPSGQENVQASYRFGTGILGNVAAKTISLLTRRPLQVRSVVNPLAATGGDDPEAIDDARVNIPLSMLTLDRIVSLQDYEDYARAFAGISKALATWTWFGQERGVYLTVAGAEGADIQDPVYGNLLKAIRAVSDPAIPVRLGKAPSYQLVFFQIAGVLSIDSDYNQEQVMLTAEQTLHKQFSFEHRSFGQDVTLSEVIGTLQSIPGIVAVNIHHLYFFDQTPTLNSRLRAGVPQVGSRAQIDPAQLLLLAPGPVDLGVQ